jgi:hypothetical protein
MRRRIRGVVVHLHLFSTRAPGGVDYFSVSVALLAQKEYCLYQCRKFNPD